MSGRPHIATIEAESNPPATQTEAAPEGEETLPLPEEWEEIAEGPRQRFAWVLPAVAALAILGWTAFFALAHGADMLAGGSAVQWSGWMADWSAPVLLVLAVWLVAMRSSSREAARFGDVSRALSQESARLEQRLTIVNRELSLAREFIAAQSRDLESLGRIATERLSRHAGELKDLIHQNSTQIETIGSVSTAALENMDKLRGELPVIANSARDVTSQIGNAGRTAHSQLNDLVSGFHRLNEFGEASERQVAALRVKIDAALTAFESQAGRLDEMATARFDAMHERGEAFRAELDNHEVEALAAFRRRADALRQELSDTGGTLQEQEAAVLASLGGRLAALRDEAQGFTQSLQAGQEEAMVKWGSAIEALRDRLAKALEEIADIDAAAIDGAHSRLAQFHEEASQADAAMAQRSESFMLGIESRRQEYATLIDNASSNLESRLAELDAAIAQRQQDQLSRTEELARRSEAVTQALGQLDERIGALAAQGDHAGGEMAQTLELLSAKLASNQELLRNTDGAIAELTDASVRLLELIQASVEHSRERLPESIHAAEERLRALAEHARALDGAIGEAGDKGKTLSDYVLAAQHESKATAADLEGLHEQIQQHGTANATRIEELKAGLATLSDESGNLAQRVQGELSEAVKRLREVLHETLAELGDGNSEAMQALAERIGEQSFAASEQAIGNRASETVAELEQAAHQAGDASREAVRQLRDQLAKVAELTGNLENRVARARERAQEQVDNDFARRVALITESLNSSAIDISKALSNDVTDTAWASYLRGDRGIFTRRAVRLLDNAEAREIADHYERDSDFREHVSRYIHDFEGMLRTMLSTRDGKALGVTLLSSDMGKLYVALAQAIDRLRT